MSSYYEVMKRPLTSYNLPGGARAINKIRSQIIVMFALTFSQQVPWHFPQYNAADWEWNTLNCINYMELARIIISCRDILPNMKCDACGHHLSTEYIYHNCINISQKAVSPIKYITARYGRSKHYAAERHVWVVIATKVNLLKFVRTC